MGVKQTGNFCFLGATLVFGRGSLCFISSEHSARLVCQVMGMWVSRGATEGLEQGKRKLEIHRAQHIVHTETIMDLAVLY